MPGLLLQVPTVDELLYVGKYVMLIVFALYFCADKSQKSLHTQLHGLVSGSAVCRVLDEVPEGCIQEFFAFYLDDFVQSMYKPNHRTSKYITLEYNVC